MSFEFVQMTNQQVSLHVINVELFHRLLGSKRERQMEKEICWNKRKEKQREEGVTPKFQQENKTMAI
jgi:hypothetical protein